MSLIDPLPDPVEVARKAPAWRDENWRFLAFLKLLPRSRRRRIDSLAAQFARAAEARIDCRSCGACCRENAVPVTGDEVARLMEAVPLDCDQRSRFDLHLIRDDDGEPAIDASPCPFLSETECSVYEARPAACRDYPYLGLDILARWPGIVERYEVCPIVFAMIESLKRAVGFTQLEESS
jgi:hypothetical protein